MATRWSWLGAWLAAAAFGQSPESAPPTLASVLAVIDAPQLDSRGFELLIDGGPPIDRLLVSAYAASGPEELLARRRSRCLRALRAMGPQAARVGPDLVELLAQAPREATPDLLDTLSVTAALGEDAARLLPEAEAAWKRLIQPGDARFVDRLRSAIRLHVRLTRPLTGDDIPTLIGHLQDPEPHVRELAAETLGRLGTAATGALGALEYCATRKDHPRQARLPRHSLGTDFAPMIQRAASIAIARIAPDDPRSELGHRALLTADDPRERLRSAMALGRMAAIGSEGALLAVLDDDDLRLVGEAITSLGMIGANSARTERELRKLRDHPQPAIAARCRATMRQLGIED